MPELFKEYVIPLYTDYVKKQKPDVEWHIEVFWDNDKNQPFLLSTSKPNLIITFDGETGNIKTAEVKK